MEAKAIAKYIKMSPTKIRPVLDLVRGKDLEEALTILKFTPGRPPVCCTLACQS